MQMVDNAKDVSSAHKI